MLHVHPWWLPLHDDSYLLFARGKLLQAQAVRQYMR